MATGTTATTYSDRVFLFRLQTLVLDGGTEVLRNIFDQRIKNQPLKVFLAKEKLNINPLRRQNIITREQYSMLYPSGGHLPTSLDFDITLIVCLLRNLTSLGLNPNYNWYAPPQTGDTSIEADVYRLKGFRNEIAHISSTTGFRPSSFQAKWNEIETVLLRLDQNSPTPNFTQTIDNYKNSPMDPANEQRIRTMMKQWQEKDRGLEADMQLIKIDVGGTKEDVKNINKDFSNMEEDVKSIKKDFNDTTKDVKNIKEDLRDTQDDIKRINKDIGDRQDDVKCIMKDVSDTKEDVKSIKKDFSDTKKDVMITRKELSDTREAFKNIRKDFSHTQDDVKCIKKDVSVTQGDVKGIKKDFSDTKKDVKNIKEDLRDTQDDIKRIKKDISDRQDDVKIIKKDIKDTKKDVKDIKKDFSHTKEDVKNIIKGSSDTQDDIKSIKKDFIDTHDDVKTIKEDVNNTKEDVKSIKKDFSDTKEDVHNIKKDFFDTQDDVKSIKKDLSDTKKDVHNMKTDFSDTQADVKSIKKGVSDTKEDIKSIKKDSSDTQDDVKGVKKDISDTKDEVENIKKDVSDLKQESNRGFFGKAGFLGRMFGRHSLRKDLQEDLISFYKHKHKNIPLSPLIKEDQPLLKFYEMPDIQSIQITRSRDGNRPKKTPIKTLRDVFYKENKLCSNIYLTANAGYGKTAFSKKLALAWCHAKKPDKSEKYYFSKDEIIVLRGFSCVFVVLLRNSSNECDIDKLIWNQICSQLRHDYSLENLKEILCKETCLVILDGLDEWTHPLNSCSQGESNIPHQRMRDNVAVLTTTRPWKLSVIGLHSSQIDQTLELEGLSNDSAKRLKRSVISHLHREQDEKNIDKYEKEFNMTVQENHKSDLTTIPLFLMYLLFLWYYKFDVGKSLADLYRSFIELLLSRTVRKDGIQIPKTGTAQGNIPPSFDKTPLCKQFHTLLTTLGKLAFYTFFSDTKENTLVFDGCLAEKYLSKDEITFCLQAGIITQSEVQGASLLPQQKTKVSFAHKTMQEFLAALYINSAPDKSSVQEIVLSKCKCVTDILDMSKIFMFVVSISAKFPFSHELMKIINEDEITQEYRSSLQRGDSLKDLQDMYISCCKDIPRKNEVNIYLQDVFIDHSCEQEEYRENLKQMVTRNNQNIRSLNIDIPLRRDIHCMTEREFTNYFALSDLKTLEKIYCNGIYGVNDILPLLNSSVKCLFLSCAFVQHAWSRFLFDSVKGLQKLEAIKLDGFNMSHSELSLLLDFISQRDCLREIELSWLFCTDHERSPCTGLSIDLSAHLSLKKLTLLGLRLSQVIINMTSLESCKLLHLDNQDLVLKFLKCEDNKLNAFTCIGIKSSACIDEMLRALRESRHVRRVTLIDINLDRRTLTLPPDCVNIERLKLTNLTMAASTLRELVNSVLKLKQTVTVDIGWLILSPREEFETLKGNIKASQSVRILEDREDQVVFATNKDGD